MFRRELILGLTAFGLAACSGGTPVARIGPDGLPLPTVYQIGANDVDAIQFRMEDSINALRQAAGVTPVTLDPNLIASAATHSRDMSVQNRPWLFGSDGSSPLDRARRAGFSGRLVGEVISESYETELETLAAWTQDQDSRAVILDPTAQRIGFAWYQEPAGKIWWTLSVGTAPGAFQAPAAVDIRPLGAPVAGSSFQG
ncbi:CAP domain-containing protein [Loktanella sp. F6476L]|uniref:CAP domain-containing protein n=1 Tax=Loktanella sp. F6476L TaxID=2926405 RepID=UPI001FF66237|nr:CAP domain-containing protein [Loktanella sp. F6476L]MCK0122067.1 CAP domain-containing protein [Loktanella sp. F6476L]